MLSSRSPAQIHTTGTDPLAALSQLGEKLARAHLHRLGFTLLGRNERARHDEIDLIAFDGHTLVFAALETRRVSMQKADARPDQQSPLWLRPRQRARLRRLAAAWLHEKQHIRPATYTIRFDAIGVVLDTKDRLLRLDHIESA